MTNFMYGLRAPESRRQYPARLKVYLDFIGFKGTISEQASQFLDKAKGDIEQTTINNGALLTDSCPRAASANFDLIEGSL
jgi:hypothetical protein